MKKNLGTTGRLLRLAVAIALLVYAYVQSSWIALGFSLFTFYEALASWCVLFQLLGINHCPVSKK